MKIVSCLLAVMIVSLGLSQNEVTNASTQKDDAQKQKVEAWEKSLRKAFNGFASNIAIDVNISSTPPFASFSKRKTEEAYLKLLATMIWRKPIPVPSGWVLVRSSGTNVGGKDYYRDFSQWFSQVPETELRDLCGAGVTFENLSEKSQELLAKWCSNPGLQEKMLRGEFVSATARFEIVIRLKDKDGKPMTLLARPFSFLEDNEIAKRELLEKNYVQPPVLTNQNVQGDGELDVSAGELLTMAEAFKKAQDVFKKIFTYDGRLSDSYVYLQGRYTSESFLMAMKTLSVTFEPKMTERRTEETKATIENAVKSRIAELIDNSSLPEGISLSDLFNGRQITFGDLAALMPSVEKIMADGKFDPQMVVTIIPGITLHLSASGSTITDPKQS
ncbi:MAG: hypothetical protein GYA32_12575, partial [Serratia sp.]|nr:hypothetical protein [Serratia sp. (in: enterobacteria)]